MPLCPHPHRSSRLASLEVRLCAEEGGPRPPGNRELPSAQLLRSRLCSLRRFWGVPSNRPGRNSETAPTPTQAPPPTHTHTHTHSLSLVARDQLLTRTEPTHRIPRRRNHTTAMPPDRDCTLTFAAKATKYQPSATSTYSPESHRRDGEAHHLLEACGPTHPRSDVVGGGSGAAGVKKTQTAYVYIYIVFSTATRQMRVSPQTAWDGARRRSRQRKGGHIKHPSSSRAGE
jgi:hypothetical protein